MRIAQRVTQFLSGKRVVTYFGAVLYAANLKASLNSEHFTKHVSLELAHLQVMRTKHTTEILQNKIEFSSRLERIY